MLKFLKFNKFDFKQTIRFQTDKYQINNHQTYQIKIMGNAQTSEIDDLNSQHSILDNNNYYQINESQWSITSNYSYTRNIDPYYGSNYKLLSLKKRPNYQIQKYQLFFNSQQQFKSYFQSYEWRKSIKGFVQSRGIKQRVNKNICSTFHQATIYIQRIPIRACQITDIPIQEGLYLLYSAFQGFKKIYQKTGYFQISLDMICINKQAQVKVWLNSNLSKNFPQFYLVNQNYSENQFINKILQLCEPLIDYQMIDQKFSQFLTQSYQAQFYQIKSTQKDNINKINLYSMKQTGKQQTKLCKYTQSKFSQLLNKSNSKNKQSLQQINKIETLKNFINFDRIIEHFQKYLSKHQLFIARQMKSIKDLFKVQKKIMFKEESIKIQKNKEIIIQSKNQNHSNYKNQPQNQLTQTSNNQNFKLQQLQIGKAKKNKKQGVKRINTKRTAQRFDTQRSNINCQKGLISYKSQDIGIRKYQSLTQNQMLNHKPNIPSVSFVYHPVKPNNTFFNMHSPQHGRIYDNQRKPRDRIQTLAVQNLSINIQSQPYNVNKHLPSTTRDKRSTTSYFQSFTNNQRKNIKINQNQTNRPNLNMSMSPNYTEIKQSEMFKKKKSMQNLTKITNKKKYQQHMHQSNTLNHIKQIQNATNNNKPQFKDVISMNKNKINQDKDIYYYAVNSEHKIDEEIGKDLNFIMNKTNNNQQHQ